MRRPTVTSKRYIGGGLAIVATAALIGFAPGTAAAAPTDVFISEYVEGSSNNKALEIFNGTGAPVNLAAGGYQLQMAFNGNPTPSLTIPLTGTVAAGDVYVVAQSAAGPAILAQADQTNGSGLVQRRRRDPAPQGGRGDRLDRPGRASTRAPNGAPG